MENRKVNRDRCDGGDPQIALIVFLRYPRPGKVKTRLAKSIGNDKACEWYRLCAENVLREVSALPQVALYVFCSEEQDMPLVETWMQSLGHCHMHVRLQQQRPNLGVRIAGAFREVYEDGHRVLGVVGTDIPDLTHEVVASAVDTIMMKRDDTCFYDDKKMAIHPKAMLGPACDGGFYLAVLDYRMTGSCPTMEMFDGVAWSTAQVLKETQYVLKEQEYTIVDDSLPVLRDIDVLEDMEAWVQGQKKEHHEKEKMEQYKQSNGSLEHATPSELFPLLAYSLEILDYMKREGCMSCRMHCR